MAKQSGRLPSQGRGTLCSAKPPLAALVLPLASEAHREAGVPHHDFGAGAHELTEQMSPRVRVGGPEALARQPVQGAAEHRQSQIRLHIQRYVRGQRVEVGAVDRSSTAFSISTRRAQ